MDERYLKRRRVDDGLSPSGLSAAQQQGYPTQQYQSQTRAHWHGSGVPPTNAPTSQPSQPTYGYSSVSSASPSHSQRAHAAHAPTRNPSMYAAPIPTAGSRCTSGSNTQGQEQYYYPGPATYPQPAQAYQQPPYTSPTHATGTYQVHTPTGSSSSGSGSLARPTPPMAPGTIPSSATVRSLQGRSLRQQDPRVLPPDPLQLPPLLILRFLTEVVAGETLWLREVRR